jgi:hypothetical protein
VQFVDRVVNTRQHRRRLGRAAQHQMNIGGEAEWMLLDRSALVQPPRRSRRRNAIGQIAVDDPGDEISKVVGVIAGRDDMILVGGIGNEAVDPIVGIDEACDDPQTEFLARKACKHLVDGAERVFGSGALLDD